MKQDNNFSTMYPTSMFIEPEIKIKRVTEYLDELHKRFEYRKKVEHSFNDYHTICALGRMKPSYPKSLKVFMEYVQLNDEQKYSFIMALKLMANSRYGILAEIPTIMMTENCAWEGDK